ncbi:hypothetical protein COLSTE_01342 [Collinsella stercoris DSM 13279]|uniref:Uncharacterized protein n=1 Tax=Collinsella stercoris DSM 13279 TaxID=445975 RepID=B6GB84_9ACTN|nr:hypothetical protein COLSTE_01342 [Collinsella stercoris DSM 13279]
MVGARALAHACGCRRVHSCSLAQARSPILARGRPRSCLRSHAASFMFEGAGPVRV